MALEGSLSTISFADVLQLLGSTRKTGVLHFRRGSAWKKLYLRDGVAIAVSSSDPGEFVGNALVSVGKISESDLRDALAAQQREAKLVGLALLEAGKIELEVLKRYLSDKAYETVAKLMHWNDAMFRFEEYTLPSAELVPLNLSVEELLMEGFRRSDELERLRQEVPEGTVLERTEVEVDDDFGSETMVGLVLSKLEQPQSLSDLKENLKTSEFSFLDGVSKLIERGAIKGKKQEQPKEQPEEDWLQDARKLILVGMSEDAISVLRDRLKGEPSNGLARSLLAKAEANFVRDLTRKELPHAAVPALVSSLDDLMECSLSPAEAFLLSRIDGVQDVESLLDSTPLPASEILLCLKRLLREGYVKLAATSCELTASV